MAVTEKSGFLKYKDAAGNTTLMYPITTKDNVDGMDEIDAHIASTDNPHSVTVDQIGAVSYSSQSLTDEQKIQARANIGVGTPDWNQNDDTASDYIKNRPFYTSDPVETSFFDNPNVGFMDSGGGFYFSEADVNLEYFAEGRTYTVMWDNVQYECESYPFEDGVAIGNATIFGMDGGNGEPFLIMTYPTDGYCMIVTSSEDASHAIQIIGYATTIYKIDEKYLPEDALIGIKGTGDNSVVFNGGTAEQASGRKSHVEGNNSTASGDISHAEGYGTTASGYASHAEGSGTTASEQASHAEGFNTTASNTYAHAEGRETTASGEAAHAEGYLTVASSTSAHAEGTSTKASGSSSHAEGYQTIAAGHYQHVQGKFNVENAGTYAHIVGNGTSDTARSNAHTVDWDGNGWFAGTIKVGGTSQDDTAAAEVETKGHEHAFSRGVTTAGTGAAYTATVDGITALEAGISFTMIPHTASTSKTATLNVNGLGAKMLRRPLSANNSTTVANTTDNWLYANKPVDVMYNGTYWIVTSMPRPNGPDIYGTVAGTSVGYDNATSGMTATTVQAAIDELYALIAQLNS